MHAACDTALFQFMPSALWNITQYQHAYCCWYCFDSIYAKCTLTYNKYINMHTAGDTALFQYMPKCTLKYNKNNNMHTAGGTALFQYMQRAHWNI